MANVPRSPRIRVRYSASAAIQRVALESPGNRHAGTSGAGKRRPGTVDGAGSGPTVEYRHRGQWTRQELSARYRLVGVDAEVASRSESTPDLRLCGTSHGCWETRQAALHADDLDRPQQKLRERVFGLGRRLAGKAGQAMEPGTRHPCSRRRWLFGLGSG